MAKDGKTATGSNVHHHYYYTGTPQGVGAEGQAAGPRQGPGGGAPGWGPAAGPASFNAHPHPRADSLVKGLVVGAGVAWLVTNESVQRKVLRTAFQLWAAVQGGVAEFKERMEDAEAEVEAAAADPEPAAPPRAPRRPRTGGPRAVQD